MNSNALPYPKNRQDQESNIVRVQNASKHKYWNNHVIRYVLDLYSAIAKKFLNGIVLIHTQARRQDDSFQR